MTFSISGRCEQTGTFGIAISSSSPAVAARCAHARPGVGVVATQNITDPLLGPKGLDLMQSGLSAEEALARLLDGYDTADYRQLVLLDAAGRVALHAGPQTLGIHAMAKGKDCAAAGNLLSNTEVPAKMVAAFETSEGALGDRLIAAMQAGVAAGGEAGPVHSAGLLMVREVSWPIADLRIDWAEEDPIGELEKLWSLYKPQLEDYVTRAIKPQSAPSYGVPGDE
ncbi:Uncharacterized conserved protein, Ntn-hydrolase superfamily [Rhizobium sp. NFR07]|uniref:DUF1028 domain-containing protein n=1 Tax=Rhizobium sp. NFR07 TaxID=1566262 RepID=UPI0008E74450|nr:DUF1028 domain-containing protein [Rhizobium sp. NFR07]SFB14935.1 Uncharacterized conserved protein, Ntn-hydrolase superfamily [Rhizobium sp. NFR07]